jgi:opacity protein-like surface antigen
MTRIVSKLGIAAALTLGMLSTAAAQSGRTTTPTKKVPVTKEVAGEVAKPDTVKVYVHDTVTVAGPTQYRRDTLTLTGPTITRWDTVSVMTTPGYLDRGNGLYFGLGAGSTTPSGGLGGGQIPGYAIQANLGVDPAGSPLGLRLTAGLARPDEAQTTSALGGRPSVLNFTGDLKLRTPFFKGTRFPMFGLYAVGGVAAVMYKDLVMEDENKNIVAPDHAWHNALGWNAGGGASFQLGHKKELFVEARAINFMKTGMENGHQLPIILGINWY